MAEQSEALQREELIEIVADIVSAYVVKNPVQTADLPMLIDTVHKSLATLTGQVEPVATKPTPAVPVRKSIQNDYIVCLEDGKKFKSLKRHLGVHYNLTPDAYREKWNLPADYPMVAPNYAAARSEMAKKMGLGRKPKPAKARRGGRAKSA